MREIITDAYMWAGAAGITYGVYGLVGQHWAAIAGGVFLFAFGFFGKGVKNAP